MTNESMSGILYIVPTPIGNLEDITLRALRVLRESFFIAAEDTRHTRKLLTHFNVHPVQLFSYHEHNTVTAGIRIVDLLCQGHSGALVTDAGMPGISDPGHDVIQTLIAKGMSFVVLPGPSAFVMALVASGLDTTAFSFHGFLPRDKKHRRIHLQTLHERPETLLFYEAPHRVNALIADLHEVLGGEREIVIARELTKLHESWYRGRLSEWSSLLPASDVRGELVVLVQGQPLAAIPVADKMRTAAGTLDQATVVAQVNRLVDTGVEKKEAMRQVAKACGVSKRDVYQMILDEEMN